MTDHTINLRNKLMTLITWARMHRLILFIVAISTIYGALLFRINLLNNQQPSSSDISAKLNTVSRPQIDQSVVNKIEQLRDNSSPTRTLFNNARNNPFQ